MTGYLLLVCSSIAYAIGLLAQSVGARRARIGDGFDIGIIGRLATDKAYTCGFAAQIVGFVLAFFARGTLPVYLVQASTCASVGLAAILGAMILGWRVTRAEIMVLAVMTMALVLLTGAAEPSRISHVAPGVVWMLTATLLVCIALTVPAWAARSAVPLACLAGAAFAVLALASRPLPSMPLSSLPLNPLAWLTLVSAAVGQLLLAVALQRGSTTSAGASMDAVTMVLASLAGTLLLGDQIAAGRTWWFVAGLVMIVGSVFAMARVGTTVAYDEPSEKTDRGRSPVQETVRPQ